MTVDPAVAQVRRAVRDALAELGTSAPLVVGCSGGADSIAVLAAAVAAGAQVHAAVVDHGLQDGSAARAQATAALARELGTTAAVHPVTVAGPGGPEAAARRARYAALRAARPHPESPVLLGHTLDDQAESVLLGLGRGSGARSIAGMRPWDPPWLRPLLGVRRATTRAACAALGLPVWDDPHNADPRFTRVRLRREVLPLLEDVLAGGVAEALARTATQLREDDEALDAVAAALLDRATCRDRAAVLAGGPRPAPNGDRGAGPPADPPTSPPIAPPAGLPAEPPVDPFAELPVDPFAGAPPAGRPAHPPDAQVLAAAPPAVRRRALRTWLLAHGVSELTDAHLRAADRLTVATAERSTVALPGGLELIRRHGRLLLRPAAWSSPPNAGRSTIPDPDGGPTCVRR